MKNYTISLPDDALVALDTLCAKHDRSRSNMIAYMAKNWDQSVQHAKGGRPKKAKDETPLPGHDGKLVYMTKEDPRTQRPGAKFLRTSLDHLPLTYMSTMPWAYPPPVVTERKKDGTLAVDIKKDTMAPADPTFIVAPAEIGDPASSLCIYKMAYVTTDVETRSRSLLWVRHAWNEALASWVPAAGDIDAMEHDVDLKVSRRKLPDHWSAHRAYGAPSVEHLKELLTALDEDFNLTPDAQGFIKHEASGG